MSLFLLLSEHFCDIDKTISTIFILPRLNKPKIQIDQFVLMITIQCVELTIRHILMNVWRLRLIMFKFNINDSVKILKQWKM